MPRLFSCVCSYTFWDGFRTITMSTVVNVIIAASAVFLVTLLLLADIVASVMVRAR